MPKSCRRGGLMSMRRWPTGRTVSLLMVQCGAVNHFATASLPTFKSVGRPRRHTRPDAGPALRQEGGGRFTAWHADEYYWPLATEKCCTVWIPLQKTPLEMGPLAFSERAIRLPMVEISRPATRASRKFKMRFQMRNFPKCRNRLIWAR